MNQSPFEKARSVFASLELFRDHYASSKPYQDHHAQVVGLLRELATNIRATKPHDANFYEGLASALEKLNGQQ